MIVFFNKADRVAWDELSELFAVGVAVSLVFRVIAVVFVPIRLDSTRRRVVGCEFERIDDMTDESVVVVAICCLC